MQFQDFLEAVGRGPTTSKVFDRSLFKNLTITKHFYIFMGALPLARRQVGSFIEPMSANEKALFVVRLIKWLTTMARHERHQSFSVLLPSCIAKKGSTNTGSGVLFIGAVLAELDIPFEWLLIEYGMEGILGGGMAIVKADGELVDPFDCVGTGLITRFTRFPSNFQPPKEFQL